MISSRAFNLPNFLTCSRFILSVVFVLVFFSKIPHSKAAAAAVFFLASLTDFWDGYLARRHGEITRFGKLMDPIADKILTLTAFVGFAVMGLVPAWMVMVIVVRDVLVTGYRLFIPLPEGAVAARSSGKQKTMVQFLTIAGILIFLAAKETRWWAPTWTEPLFKFIHVWMFAVVGLTLWSGLRILTARPRAE